MNAWCSFADKLPDLGQDIEIDAESWVSGRVVYAGKVLESPRRTKPSDVLITSGLDDQVWIVSCQNALGALVKGKYKWRAVHAPPT